SEVTVDAGNNFWKIARGGNVNIDTLISANPFWKDLNARTRQTVIVPSEKGVLHFINDFSQIEAVKVMYGVSDSEIIVQDLPFLYRYWYRLKKDRFPVAVFIKDVKPASSMMTETLAKNFEVREMFRSPLGGRFSSYFGRRNHPIFRTDGFHNGLDIASPQGTPVGAASAGVVMNTGWMGGYGKAVIIDHQNGYKTLYGHLSSIAVRQGQKVKPGNFVGRVGSTGWSTGPHLHFTVWHEGRPINPMNILW
ncbi:MAG: M23 family metallopeptidase, partial [Spirochaetota bacterium]